MNITQQNRDNSLQFRAGFIDAKALTINSTDGDIPDGRELSLSWLAGIVMTALTGLLLMGGALYISFLGQDSFSTTFEALKISKPDSISTTFTKDKTSRVRPIAPTRSDKEIVEAAIRENINGRTILRKQPFVRIKATLATATTALSASVPKYDPVALLARTQTLSNNMASVSTDIYGARIEGEIAVKTTPLPSKSSPIRTISDKNAAEFVARLNSDISFDGEFLALGYEQEVNDVRDIAQAYEGGISGIAQNVSRFEKTRNANDEKLNRLERILTIKEQDSLENILIKNGFTPLIINSIIATLQNVYPSTNLPKGARLRILFGSSTKSDALVPYRLSIYIRDIHAATVALTDSGRYVLGIAPPAIEFRDEDIEEINVNNLPSIYNSIWETARKHDIADKITDRIIAMFAYDLDLTKPISVGDSIEILKTLPNEQAEQELLYISLKLGSLERKFYRFTTSNGEVDFYDIDGQTGKQFLIRRPLKGGGNLRSRFGYRIHPITGRSKLHTGTDLAAPYGTPIYAAGDGIVEMARWNSGYGRYVRLKHVNGFTTAYAHMSRIASNLVPGGRVKQGQIIGYVGSTGQSTGNHLHFEMRINNRPVDALSVKLPRDKILPQQYSRQFKETIAQINDLMQREPAPVTLATKQ